MFKECPHPDENQRQLLSRDLGLAPRQIKFWFQNKRTQTKVVLKFQFSPLIFQKFFDPSRFASLLSAEVVIVCIVKFSDQK